MASVKTFKIKFTKKFTLLGKDFIPSEVYTACKADGDFLVCHHNQLWLIPNDFTIEEIK